MHKSRVGFRATVYAAAGELSDTVYGAYRSMPFNLAAQYLTSVVLERASHLAAEKNGKKSKSSTVRPRHIMLAFRQDEELNKVCPNSAMQLFPT